MLIRLHTLALAIWQIYSFGAEWIIISDGISYASIFEIPIPKARYYQTRLRDYRNRLNLQETVHIIDLSEMTSRLTDTADLGFEAVFRNILHILEQLDNNGSISKTLRTLVHGIQWNINYNLY